MRRGCWTPCAGCCSCRRRRAMSDDNQRALGYLREVYEDSQRFALTLLRENERLRKQNAELQHELAVRTAVLNAHAQRLVPSAASAAESETIEARLRSVERENERLSAEH